MQPYVALASQREGRDLRLLPRDGGRWLAAGALAEADEPAIVVGSWVLHDPSAKEVFRRRQERGTVTLLVARFEPGDLADVLGTPVSVRIVPAEGAGVVWRDGTPFSVPAMAAIETPLPDGHWAKINGKTVVLAWRPHTRAGLTVLCTPTVTARALGADIDAQQRLLEHILAEAQRYTSARQPEPTVPQAPSRAVTASEYLSRFSDEGALVLLAWLANPRAEIDPASLSRLGVTMDSVDLTRLIHAMPAADPGEIRGALKAAGWGAHLRRLGENAMEEP